MPAARETFNCERVVGRRIVAADRAFYRELWCEPAVVHNLGGPASLARIDAKVQRLCDAWDRDGYGVYTLCVEGAPVGYAGLAPTDAGGRVSVEILYGLMPALWGRGLATEVARALVRLARDELALADVCAYTWTGNHRSRRVLEKAGLVYAFEFARDELAYWYYRLP